MQQGLANNNTNDACFDKNGFVWITSLNGLNLFDGKNVFHFNKQSHPELPVNQLSNISCDSRNRIWVCSDFGLAMLDERRKVHSIVIKEGEPGKDVDFCFEVLHKGMIIIGENKNYFLPHDQSKVQPIIWLDKILNGEKVTSINKVDDAHFLIQQLDRIVMIDFIKQIIKFEIKLENLASLCVLNPDELLAVTKGFELHQINFRINKIIKTQTGLKDQHGQFIRSEVRAMVKAANKKIYLTTKGEGLIEYDIEKKLLTTYLSDVKVPNSISTNVIHLASANADGYLVFTSDLGIQFTNVNNFGFQRQLYGHTGKKEIFFEAVKSVLQDNRKQFWISAANNLIKTDSNGNHAVILNRPGQASGNILPRPLQMDMDSQDNIWVPFRNDGLYVFDISGKIVKSFTGVDLPKPVESLRLIKKVKSPYLFIGTDKGLFTFNSKSLKIDSTRFEVLEKALDKERIVDILSSGEDIWIATSPNGSLWHYNMLSKKIIQFTEKNGLPSNRIYCLASTHMGDILVGTYEGLSIIRNGKIIKTLTVQNGLINPRVDNIQVDENGMAWITNHNAILKYDITKDIIQYFDERNGILNFSFSIGSSFQTVDKEILFGTTYGLLKFKPTLVNQKIIQPKIIINRLLDDNLMQNVSLENNFKLPYKDAKLNFYFTSSDLIAGNRIMYRYFLEELDNTWSEPTTNHQITYNLSPGNYTFRLQASYNSSDWIESENTASITVVPPFWQRLWFISLVALIVILSGFFLHSNNQKRKSRAEGQKLVEYFATNDNHYSNIDDLLWDIARNIVSRLSFEDCVIYLFDEERDMLVQKAAAGPKNPGEKQLINFLEIPIGKGIVGTAAATKKPLLVKNTNTDNRYIRDDAKRLSELAIPIIYNNELLGVIDSENRKRNFYTNEHVRILSTVAAISADKIASLKAKNILEIQDNRLKELNQQMNETRLSAIRAQMNPHFLFNSLNAIQECIISEKYDAAYEYLSRFSKLLRLVLNHSEKNFISLNEELETIQLYLSLEELRFNHTFTYEIAVNENIETDDVMVPSLLLQPFVENAIWHGLINKEGIKKLKLSFKEEKNMIKCIIEDNGIGRKRSAWIKEQKLGANQFASRGTLLSEKRIQILNQQFSNMAQIETIDHYDQGQKSMGTSVIITLPLDIENT